MSVYPPVTSSGLEEIALAERPAVLGRVLGLLGFAFAFVFTAGGALLGQRLGPAALLVSIVGSLGTLFALMAAREKAPWNLGLLYAFATFEGLALGVILETYVARGLGAWCSTRRLPRPRSPSWPAATATRPGAT